MPKPRSMFVCTSCGCESPKWLGKCPDCDSWNTFEEQAVINAPTASKMSAAVSYSPVEVQQLDKIEYGGEYRYPTGLSELDNVLGGGIVKGSLVLIGGDPGIGKSTILLQICQYLCRDLSVLYVSGEESARQLKLRADRLSVNTDRLLVLCGTDIESICEYVRTAKPDIVIVDSIQTMHISSMNSSAGSTAQIRECTSLLQRTAKNFDISIVVVGHVTKDGALAGPKVMEHIVDAVLYFEGERNLSYRILRAVKNRFGSTNEIGVFEMGNEGLIQVENPSKMLLSERPLGASGTVVSCIIEGTRPILAEIQALATPTGFGNPRRQSSGFDQNRLNLLLAILEKRAGLYFSTQDAYLNVIGGIRLDETAADLPVALALISSLKDKPIDADVIAFGEIGLAGEVRATARPEKRIIEAIKLGFETCILPEGNKKNVSSKLQEKIKLIGIKNIREAKDILL